jgi:Protein of unknown function (DUF3352)
VSRFFSGREALRGIRGRVRRGRAVAPPAPQPPPAAPQPADEPAQRFDAPAPTAAPAVEEPPPPVETSPVVEAPPAREPPRRDQPPPRFEPPSSHEAPPLFGPARPAEPPRSGPEAPLAEPPRPPRRRRRPLGGLRARRRGRVGGAIAGGVVASGARRLGAGARAAGRGAHRVRELVAAPVRAAADAWLGLSIYVRRRLAVLAALAGLIAAFFLLAVPALPCQFPGGSACPATDDAVKLVPGDALVYVHADLDRSTSQYQLASSLAARIPTLSAQIISPFAATIPGTGGMPGFVSDVRPWLGDEAALALLPARGPPQQIELLAVGDDRGAGRYRRRLEGRAPRTRPYRGIDIELGRGGVASAIVNGFLVVGTRAGVRQVIDAGTGAKGATPLASAPAASRVRDELPANRVADAYLSPAGVAAVAGRATGILSSLAPFVAPGATKGTAAALVANADTIDLEIRSVLDPQRVRSRPGFFAAFAPFEEKLASRLPAATLAYVGFGEPGRVLTALLSQAGTEEPGLARSLTRVLRKARRAAHVRVRRDALPALGDEAALALEPAPRRSGRPARRTPYVLYAGDGVNARRARTALARLQRPLLRSVGSGRGGGHRPGIAAGNVAGTTTESLRISPALDLTYAVADGLLIAATKPAGVAAMLRPSGETLGATDTFGQATSGLGGNRSLLAYLNLRGLVAVGEQAGLSANPGYRALAPEVHRLEALGVSVASAPDDLETSVRLLVGG